MAEFETLDTSSIIDLHQMLLGLRSNLVQAAQEKASNINGLKEKIEAMQKTANHIQEQKTIIKDLKKNNPVDVDSITTQINNAKTKLREYL